ncbi:DUF3098 domain-containing protein [Bacteroidota bacterium]
MSEKQNKDNTGFAFGKQNYLFLLIGFVIIVLGLILMSGGNGDDPTKFYPEIFNFRRITLAPIVCLLGFGIVIYSIMKKPKK